MGYGLVFPCVEFQNPINAIQGGPPTSYKYGYNSTYRGYNPSYPIIRPFTRVITPFITSRGPPCRYYDPLQKSPNFCSSIFEVVFVVTIFHHHLGNIFGFFSNHRRRLIQEEGPFPKQRVSSPTHELRSQGWCIFLLDEKLKNPRILKITG